MLLLAPAAHAAFGLGVAIGSPTGVTASVYVTDRSNLDFLIGQGWGDGWKGERLLLSGDYVWHLVDLADGDVARLDLYVGAGLNVWTRPGWGTDLGVEGPVGLALFFRRAPVELYGELVPGAVLTDPEWFDLGGSVGVRYYFGTR